MLNNQIKMIILDHVNVHNNNDKIIEIVQITKRKMMEIEMEMMMK